MNTWIRNQLFQLQDKEYKEFHAKLMPTIHPDTIIGIRIPVLRKFAKEIRQTQKADSFLHSLPHQYYEENNLHAFLIAELSNYEVCIEALDTFLPYIDNWATCDSLRPRVFKKNREKLILDIERWVQSPKPYSVRFGIEMLMVHFLDENFRKEYLEMVSDIRSDEYYVNMMIAWYFATALAKQYETALPFLENNLLDVWTHNKTIQKAVESYRIPSEQKDYLKSLKR